VPDIRKAIDLAGKTAATVASEMGVAVEELEVRSHFAYCAARALLRHALSLSLHLSRRVSFVLLRFARRF
jgi:hypothetical protein